MQTFKMSPLQEDKSICRGCRRILIELPEYFARKTAILGAMNLAAAIDETFSDTLTAMRDGRENAEEQNESVRDASIQLHMASIDMRDNISRTKGIEVEWIGSVERMGEMVAGMSAGTARMEELVGRLGGIQHILDEVGFQTNISSLNAIINASQTVSKGEIFAVVAEEVRKASHETREHIRGVLETVGGVGDAITRSGRLFADLNRSIGHFKTASEEMISLSNRMVSSAKQEAAALKEIGSAVAKIGGYTRESRSRYRSISSRESEIRVFIGNLNDILTHRFGFFGPFRLDKTVSLDNQRINVENVHTVVRTSIKSMEAELGTLSIRSEEMENAGADLQAIEHSFRDLIRTAGEGEQMMSRDITREMQEIALQNKGFGGTISKIEVFLDRVESLKSDMQHSILFNDMLPLVAGMAALIAEGEHNLQFRVQELDALLNRLRETTRDIDEFLKKAGEVLAEMKEKHRNMISELANNQKIADQFRLVLKRIIKDAPQHKAMTETVGSFLLVIRNALEANTKCARRIESENRHLIQSIANYIDILDMRSNRAVEEKSVAGEDIGKKEERIEK